MQLREKLWQHHANILRDPMGLFGENFEQSGINPTLFKFKCQGMFLKILEELKISLIVSREYENLLCSIKVVNGKVISTYFHLPHPSGIVFNEDNSKLYVAATRNPNIIHEFQPNAGYLSRMNLKIGNMQNNIWFPSRSKVYAGAMYFHDLNIIGKDLYVNSVGTNSVIKVDFNDGSREGFFWYPNCVTDKSGKLKSEANYLQLNSIGAGNTFEESYFSASCDGIKKYRPGHIKFKVDKEGVIFSGRTKEPIVRGLTRPHSVRIFNNEIWVNNSGYGEVGKVENGKFSPIIKLNGWTRGLTKFKNYLFVGTSRVLPKFGHYAPGIISKIQNCGISIIEYNTGELLGSFEWSNGNQIFGIETISNDLFNGFPYPVKYKNQKLFHNMFSLQY
jgi:uncharacterized protein (TIGR03032 family)